jgi:Tol biopolymer transport system component
LRGAKEDIVVMDIDGSNVVRLTDDIAKDRGPEWTPDGENLIFHSTRSGTWEYWTIHKDGSGLRQLTDLGEISGITLDADGSRTLVNANYYDEMWLGQFDKLSTRDSARQLLTDIPGFNPVSWSRTGDLIVGVVYGDDGRGQGYGIYDLSRDSYTPLEVPPPTAPRQAMVAGWLPDSKRIVLVSGTHAAVYDSRTGESCSIMSVEPMLSFDLSSDGRSMMIERESVDSAVWLLRFENL